MTVLELKENPESAYRHKHFLGVHLALFMESGIPWPPDGAVAEHTHIVPFVAGATGTSRTSDVPEPHVHEFVEIAEE